MSKDAESKGLTKERAKGRKITVENCGDCPHRAHTVSNFHHYFGCGKKGNREIINLLYIPDWCPLDRIEPPSTLKEMSIRQLKGLTRQIRLEIQLRRTDENYVKKHRLKKQAIAKQKGE